MLCTSERPPFPCDTSAVAFTSLERSQGGVRRFMRRFARATLALTLLVGLSASSPAAQKPARPSLGSASPSFGGQAGVDRLVSGAEVGRSGGQLVVIERTEPRTLNPVIAIDSPSKDVVWRTMADLIHINRETQQTEPALARSWVVSPDGRRFTISLRRGVRFSDGDPFDADDVLFSFQVYMDEKVAAPQRDLLIVGGQPIAVRKLDQETVQVDVAEPYAAAERLFDTIAMLPRHLLEKPYKEGRLAEAWGLRAPAEAFAGLGPFRFKEYLPGERIVLERNPFYWKADRAGNQLPYLDRIVFMFVPSEDAQAVRFQSGEADVTTRLSAANFAVLLRDQGNRNYELLDRGPGLDYTFLFFNQNNLAEKAPPALARKLAWFRQLSFRQAVSRAIDREGIVRLAYRGRATPLWGHVPPGNRLWVNRSLPRPGRSVEHARQLLQKSGFAWKADGTPGRHGGSAGRVHRGHQRGQHGTDPDRDDHSRRPEAARDARERRDPGAARPPRPALDDARVRSLRARPGRQRRRSKQRDECLALERQHPPLEPGAEPASHPLGS